MKRVLLVDDDPLVLKMFRDGLIRHDFQVETASDGLEAMKALRVSRPDVAVLDLMMPKLTGVDVLKFIRSDKNLASLPVIVLSNSYINELAEGARVAGVQEALLKSQCTPSALVQAINEVLGLEDELTQSPAPLDRARRFPGHPTARDATLVSEEEVRRRAAVEFLRQGGETCAALKTLCAAVAAAPDVVQQTQGLEAFYRKVHFVTASAGVTGCQRIGKICSVLEALLFILIDQPAQLNASVLRTLSSALELLQVLFQGTVNPAEEPLLNPQILVVDDDPLSNRLEVMALRRAQLQAYGIENPEAAFRRLQETHYDMILLDVEMPGLDGFEFCRRVRAVPKYHRTPIVYVTGHTDLETRAEGLLSGGNDVITKPIFPMELAVKAVTQLLRAGLPADELPD